MGHVRDLPENAIERRCKKRILSRNTKSSKEKKSLVQELKDDRRSQQTTFYLATDPDREGEAISWHLAYILGPQTRTTKTASRSMRSPKHGVSEGMEHPRSIDQNLVNAQQARRILDRLVGYKLSPFLSQKIRRGLSGGRVQSVAVRIIVDREEEIRAFKPEEYWSIDAKFIPQGSRKVFPGLLLRNGGRKAEN